MTLGDMTRYLGICRSSQRMFEGVLLRLSQLYEYGRSMIDLAEFLARKPHLLAAGRPGRTPSSGRCRKIMAPSWDAGLTRGANYRAASGRRWRWRGHSCGHAK